MKAREQLNSAWPRCLLFVGYLILSSSIVNAQQPFGDAKKNCDDENNTMQIRTALRVTKSGRQPVIRIEVYSERAFPGLNAGVVLLVGEHVIHGAGYRDKGHVLIFALSPEEFAKTKSGDEVIVTFQDTDLDKVQKEDSDEDQGRPHRVWKFGKLDKSKIDK